MKFHSDYIGLKTATNSNEMRRRFQEQLHRFWRKPVELKEFYIPRIFPKGEDSFIIQYQMVVRNSDTDYKPLILYGHMVKNPEQYPLYIKKDNNSSFVFDDIHLVVPVFPFDPRLNKLVDLCSPVKAKLLLEDTYKVLGLNGNCPDKIRYELLGYRLEKRCVLHYTLDFSVTGESKTTKREIIAKILNPRQSTAGLKNHNILKKAGFHKTTSDNLTIPEIYHADIKNGILFMEYVRGASVHDLTGDKNFKKACESAANLLHKLHKISSPELPIYTEKQEMIQLQNRVSMITKVFPDWSSLYTQALRNLETSLECFSINDKRTCIHRDFYDKQILYSPERTTLLDFDNLCLGDPAQDYGNFIAHLILRMYQEPERAKNIVNGMRAFENTYPVYDNTFVPRTEWWQNATLLRLAVLYALRPRWRQLAPAILQKINDYKPVNYS